MSIQMQQLFKQHQTQQFLAQQFSTKQEKMKPSNLMAEQQNEKSSNKQNNERHKEESPSQRFNNYILKPSQKPSQQNHTQKCNIKQLQNKSNNITEQIQDKSHNFNKQRSQSPNSFNNQSQLNDEQQQRRPASFANDASHKQRLIPKSPNPHDLQESIVTTAFDKQAIPQTKNSTESKLKVSQQVGSYSSAQQFQQRCPLKLQSHSSTNSLSSNSKSNFVRKLDQNTNHTPTKLTTTTLNTEYSKCKSINKEQSIKAIIYDQDRENDMKILNIGTPSTYLHSKISIEQQSVDESLGNKFQQGKLLSQYSPLIGSNDNLENVLPTKTCANHRNKRAKYKVEECSKLTYYCSQCAIEVASQGKVVQEINQLKIKSSETQIPTFQSKLIELNGNANQTEMQFKEKQLSGFLKKLDASQTLRQDILGQMQLQIEQITQWYENQIRKCEESRLELQNLLNEASNYCISNLQMQQQESLKQISILLFVLQQHHQETNNIRQDIENNWNAVLKTIKMEPFQKIMDNHQIELVKMNEFTQSMLSITIGLKQQINPDIKPIIALITQNFQLQDEKRLLIQNSSNQNVNQPKFTQMTSAYKKTEDNEMPFQQSMTQQRIRTNFSSGLETQSQQQDRQFNSNQKLIHDNIIQVNHSKLQQPKNNNLYVSFENKDLFMNIVEQEYKAKKSFHEEKQQLQMIESQHYQENQMSEQNSPKSTPHSPASGQMKQSIQRTVTKTEDTQQISSDVIQKQKSTFRKLFENIDDPQSIEKMNEEVLQCKEVSDKNLPKLNKISNNSSKTQQFFQQSIESNQTMVLETPDLKKNELENLQYLQYLQDTETCKKALDKRSQLMESVKKVNLWDDQQNVGSYGKSDLKETGQILNFRELMHFSDLKARNHPLELSQNNKNLEIVQEEQKSLFCSPQFKDQDDINISESSCISN
ncbi:unnamed protein product (macronuclear) [Paramecium tetraurelia]|uniref:Uncharacterized protein n=1 Tax=Paramecium tetraurelia TaxID=5888 RepID=A0BFJ8_PARTE|nr:uncharacterized protein GSPATT00028350001 [Paramecium tetraurelia]CAK57315.1 unnamed protein product [Paramecium tetraurelia]|eukprot:XP_001424713.1 hypothetical protein (macronuclear) [Paramecium tetraurelia strain d4-2]